MRTKSLKAMQEAAANNLPVSFNSKITNYRELSYALLSKQTKTNQAFYRKKIAKFIRWWRKKMIEAEHVCGQIIPDTAELKLENAKKAPSWRRIARCVAKGDVYCTLLGFSIPKSASK